jgi:hypothetical protein
MPTPFDDLYTAAKAIMADVNTAASTTLTQAPTNYGTDFRIIPGEARYQVQISPEKDYPLSSNESYPRAIVTVLIHHYAESLANEESFLHNAMSFVADKLLVASIWSAESGIYDLQPEVDPEMEDGGRIGNVITFEASAVVLMDAP